jgi:TonB family protein
MNEKKTRLLIFIITAAIHLLIIFFFVFDMGIIKQEIPENARVMKLTDIAELPPELPTVEEIAEEMIETDTAPLQNVVAAGSLSFDDYLPMHQVSVPPVFDEKAFVSSLVYPPIAQRSGIGGKVLLELYVDRTGIVKNVKILREDPEGRGFGEAAVKAFTGRKGTPAYANGEAVSCHFRYPVVFTIK